MAVLVLATPNGDPPIGASAPVPESIVNPETVPSSRLATYRNLFELSIAIQFGPFPTGIGELGTAVSAPVLLTANPEIDALLEFAT